MRLILLQEKYQQNILKRFDKSYIFSRPRGPLKWLDPGAFGTLGVGGGFALGAKLCRPDSDVWIIYGDGSLGYSVAEFDTFTRHKVREVLCFARKSVAVTIVSVMYLFVCMLLPCLSQ